MAIIVEFLYHDNDRYEIGFWDNEKDCPYDINQEEIKKVLEDYLNEKQDKDWYPYLDFGVEWDYFRELSFQISHKLIGTPYALKIANYPSYYCGFPIVDGEFVQWYNKEFKDAKLGICVVYEGVKWILEDTLTISHHSSPFIVWGNRYANELTDL